MKIIQIIVWIWLWTIVLLLGILAINIFIDNKKDEEINEITINSAPILYDSYLNRLIDHECFNCGPRYKRIDSNGKYSYGCLQFQLQTFISMARRTAVASKEDTDVDIVGHIYECDYQKRIASSMFEQNKVAASYHWYTTIYTRGLGLPKEI